MVCYQFPCACFLERSYDNLLVTGLPVGGVGESGCKSNLSRFLLWDAYSQAFVSLDGFYGGKFAFDTFSYLRVSLNNPSWYVQSHSMSP